MNSTRDLRRRVLVAALMLCPAIAGAAGPAPVTKARPASRAVADGAAP